MPSKVRADKQGRGQEHANSPKQYATKTKQSAKAKHVCEWSQQAHKVQAIRHSTGLSCLTLKSTDVSGDQPLSRLGSRCSKMPNTVSTEGWKKKNPER